jgi:DNA-binding NtrC family response regulator
VDLVLADVRMPGMDGVALLRALRALQPRVPVVLMTAYGTVDDALSAMKQGATDYVTKPLRIDAVVATVAKALAAAPDRPRTVRDAAREVPDAVEPPPRSEAPADSETPERGVVAWLRERAGDRGLPPGSPGEGLREVVHLAELTYVDELLRMTEGNVSRAAEMAGITRPNMHRKILDLGLDANSYRRAL